MAGIIGQGVTLVGLVPQVFAWTWNVSGVVAQANVGELVTQDLTADNTVKLLGDGDAPLGQLITYEDRKLEGIKVGTVNLKGGFRVATTGVVVKGGSVVGSATAGKVKAAGAANRTLVVAVDAVNNTADIVFL